MKMRCDRVLEQVDEAVAPKDKQRGPAKRETKALGNHLQQGGREHESRTQGNEISKVALLPVCPHQDQSPQDVCQGGDQSQYQRECEIRHDLAAVPDVHDIAILNPVVLAFEPERALGSCRSFRARAEQRIPVNGLGANKMLFQISMNRPRGLLGTRIDRDGPGTALIFTYSEERDQTEELVALADETVKPTLNQT